jgi:hypothetical protein
MPRLTQFPPQAEMTVGNVPRSMQHAEFLAVLANRLDWRAGVELGVARGGTIARLLELCPALRMVGVDLWEPQPGHTGPEDWADWDHDGGYVAARAAIGRCGGRGSLLRMRTTEAACCLPDGVLDFVFIDADHSTEGCAADIRAWLPKLKPSGWISGHDINWPTVRVAVDDLVPGYMVGPDSVWFRPVHPRPNWWTERFA